MIELYIALAILNLLAAAIYAALPGRWFYRALATLAATFATITVLWAVPDTSGRPTGKSFPEDAQVVSCFVAEPTYIYLWILDDRVPISYRLPYSRDLHRVCEAVNQATQQGVKVGLKKANGHERDNRRARLVPYVLPPIHGTKENR